MVYVIDADYCARGTVTHRNMLFTAITKTKALGRITGVDEDIDVIADEINAYKENNYTLKFSV